MGYITITITKPITITWWPDLCPAQPKLFYVFIPISVTHEDIFCQQQFRSFFLKSSHPSIQSTRAWQLFDNLFSFSLESQFCEYSSTTAHQAFYNPWGFITQLLSQLCKYFELYPGHLYTDTECNTYTNRADLEKVEKCPQAENLEFYNVLKIAWFAPKV